MIAAIFRSHVRRHYPRKICAFERDRSFNYTRRKGREAFAQIDPSFESISRQTEKYERERRRNG